MGGGMALGKKHTTSLPHNSPLARPPPTALRTHAHNHPSMLKLPKSPINIPISLYLHNFQVPILFQFKLIDCFCCHDLSRETIPCINYSLSESPLLCCRLNSPLLYSQAVAPGPITVYFVEQFICTYYPPPQSGRGI